MRILYDSKQTLYKSPFGTLTPGQECTLNIHIPASVQATGATCELLYDDQSPAQAVKLEFKMKKGVYEIFQGKFSLANPALYFYFFRIHTRQGDFRLYKQGDDTNMEAGDLWQLSCVPADFTTPEWAQGAIIYQVFPDRFHAVGKPNLTGKLEPYTVHKNWYEDVEWRPTPEGVVLNNDFYGGNFKGITEKMDYIASLGTTILYLNPISKSFSSHRYDTGDYKTPDPMLGTEKDFAELCRAAHARGIKVILDGVYSHTGSNSLYFNRDGVFDSKGAFQTKDSPYYSWYTFYEWPLNYHSWWDFNTLPTVNKMDPEFIKYIITDEDSVVAHWMKLGADGYRLDVADELPDEFIKLLRDRIKAINPDALLLGEVWEDASNKMAYGKRRRYFTDGELDSVMNYPFRRAIIDYVCGADDGRALAETVMTIAENYPRGVLGMLMNMLSTHDTPRILSVLSPEKYPRDKSLAAGYRMSEKARGVAERRLRLAAFMQFTLPGIPCIYYGDEVGMEGYRDPFNRRPYPWGRGDTELLAHYRRLAKIRRTHAVFADGETEILYAGDGVFDFVRRNGDAMLRICVNRSSATYPVQGDWYDLLSDTDIGGTVGIAPDTAVILMKR